MRRLLLVITVLILVVDAHAQRSGRASGSGNGGGFEQLIAYLSGPTEEIKTSGKNPDFDEARSRRIFLGSARFGLDVLKAMFDVGYDFDFPKKATTGKKLVPLTQVTIQRAFDKLPSLEEKTPFVDELNDEQGKPLWAKNHKETGVVELNRSAWSYTGENLLATCMKSFTDETHLDPETKMVVTHCFRMLAAAIAAHEVLSLVGIEADGVYPYTAALLLFIGVASENKETPWEILLKERQRLSEFIEEKGHKTVIEYRKKHAKRLKNRKGEANFHIEPLAFPWLTLVFAYYMEPIQKVMNKAIFRTGTHAPRPPTGTYDYMIAPFNSQRIASIGQSHLSPDETAQRIHEEMIAPYFKGCRNFEEMAPALNVIDTSRRIALLIHAENNAEVERIYLEEWEKLENGK